MIEQDLARIAVALEQIAQVMAGLPVGRVLSPPERKGLVAEDEDTPPSDLAEESRKPEPTDIDAETHRGSSAAEGEEAAKREQIKADLRLLGVAFKDSARTSTLMKMLDDKLASVAPKGDGGQDTAAPTGDGGQDTPPESAAVSCDDVRAALRALSVAKGKDAALEVLHTVGMAEKLSDVAEERYLAIVAACKEQCDA